MKIDNLTELIEKVYKTMNIISGEMKTAWDYGIGFPLYHSEVHLLEAVKLREGANAGEMARFLGINKQRRSQPGDQKIDKKGPHRNLPGRGQSKGGGVLQFQ
jgi:hypothetical protein